MDCRLRLPILPHACKQCAQPLPEPANHCGDCIKNNPPFTRTHVLFLYEPPIRHWILGLKFQDQLQQAVLFAQLLLERMDDWYAQQPYPDILLPVPLHPRRLRERGYNQAVEIAKTLSAKLNIPLDLHGIQRNKATLPQSMLSSDQRRRNIANAFICKKNYQGLTVAVVDDVITTGYTVNALANLLIINGAKEIHVWSVARAT